ncbi:neurogenic protein big brain isoform X2 [Frieseomelitta varia]|uniref:neurogenic protein big brain isoform X2 n=1 Tax=Frieseomelitta varia TaxID=561572 RepID=UPI001CB69C4E|nr:neurogenic protein big brain isoform X2 [Frieseomelitta varia]
MTTETFSKELDAHIVTLLTRISSFKESNAEPVEKKAPMSIEARSLELWRAVAVECFATFVFSLVVSGAAASSAVSGSGLSVLATAVASGFAISAICFIFGHISGGHVNPAVSVSFALCRRVSLLRAALYVAAQCGGGIAGAAMLYGVTTPSNTQTLSSIGRLGGPIERLLVELTLSVLIVLAHFTSESSKALSTSISSKPAGVLAAAYTAATLVSSPFLNPARALGPAFVSNRWDNHWVYWVGPLSGSAVAALLHEYVLNPKRSRDPRDMDDGDNSSMRSDEDTYDDLDKPTGPKFPSAYATYRPVAGASSSIYSAPPTALERVESIYGGTKSLYCKSPPLTRANLNRSQSVYAKSTSGARDGLMIPKPGPLVPAQSLYPIRIGQTGSSSGGRDSQQQNGSNGPSQSSQNHNSTNQNMQNQLQQCTQSIYGIRGISTSLSSRENGVYDSSSAATATTAAAQQQQQQQQHQNGTISTNSDNAVNSRRPESMYGHISRRSDDSAYGSYQGSTRGNYGKVPGPPGSTGPSNGPSGPPQYREQGRPSPAGPLQQNQQSTFQRNSPNPQY